MKKFIQTDSGRIFKLEGLMYMSTLKEKYPRLLTTDTKFDEDGKPSPIYYFEIVYKDSTVIPEYDDIEEIDRDREQLLNELNND